MRDVVVSATAGDQELLHLLRWEIATVHISCLRFSVVCVVKIKIGEGEGS